jgi:TPR repeat protein
MGKVLLPAIVCAALLAMASACADDVRPLSEAALKQALSASEVQQALPLMNDAKRDAEVVALFSRAAEQENPVAQAYLAYLSYLGHGLPQNDRVAADWYLKSARQGFVDAQLRLGIMFKNGRELPDPARRLEGDYTKALEWLHRAADQGSAPALTQIGEIYFLNQNTDIPRARDYFRSASASDPWAIALMCFTYKFQDQGSAEREQWCGAAANAKTADLSGNEGQLILNSDQMPMGDTILMR